MGFNIFIATKTSDSHLTNLHLVFKAIQDTNLKFRVTKCKLKLPTINVLGHLVTDKGILPDPEKIVKMHPLTTLKETRGFLGLCRQFQIFPK